MHDKTALNSLKTTKTRLFHHPSAGPTQCGGAKSQPDETALVLEPSEPSDHKKRTMCGPKTGVGGGASTCDETALVLDFRIGGVEGQEASTSATKRPWFGSLPSPRPQKEGYFVHCISIGPGSFEWGHGGSRREVTKRPEGLEGSTGIDKTALVLAFSEP